MNGESNHRSEAEVLVGQKRGIGEVEDTSENSSKRVKMRDLQSVFRSEGQVGNKATHPDVNPDSRVFGINVNVGSDNCTVSDDAPCFDESNKPPPKEEVQHNDGITKARGFDLDLNAEDISNSMNDPFYPYKKYEDLKSLDDLECGSSVGPFDEKESMRVWNGLKENNFMSARVGTVTSIPKPRGRKKNNNDIMRKKVELAKKEQVDRFARVAAPSGLLNGLNPGIINHVRNSKQVFSIIEAIVKSKRNEKQLSGSKNYNEIKSSAQEHAEKKELEKNYAFFSKSVYLNTEFTRRGDACMGQTKMSSKMPPPCNIGTEDDSLALKLSSSATLASENTSCLSNDESGNLSSVTSLSVKAANVASQWLELLSQDIRGRLAALRRSKKRVRAVITTELPLLISREFSSDLEKDTYTTDGSTSFRLDQATANAHSVRWNAIFGQMDKALSEEENYLESWLNQVKEMQLHCEKGLYKTSLYHASHQIGSIGNDSRSVAADNSEKDLAVRAAAASIYSTCNFLLSVENPACC